MEQHIEPSQATIGMHVVRFEGSWLHHPFWRARFTIKDEKTLAAIRSSIVDAIVIDIVKGVAPAVAAVAPPPASKPLIDAPTPQIGRTAREGEPEVDRARQLLKSGKILVTRLFDDARLGQLTITPDVPLLVENVARSVERSQSTLINMVRLKNKDEYTYLHSVAVCALMINFARQLGLPESEVHDLGIAGLLHDVGKMAIAPEILNKEGRLTDAEFDEIKRHTIAGKDLLTGSGNLPAVAIDVAVHHHERVDGSGYPFGLDGGQISRAAKMGAICDIYDALTSDRCYKSAWTPSDALERMAGWKGHLDPDLLFSFSQSLAIFPAGMLVRLRSNRLAVVLPNGRRGSRAMARTFFNAVEREFLPVEDVAITPGPGGDQVVRREEPAHWPFPQWARLHEDLMSGKGCAGR